MKVYIVIKLSRMAENTEITVEVSGLQEKGLLQPIFTHFGRKKSIGFLSLRDGEKGTFSLHICSIYEPDDRSITRTLSISTMVCGATLKEIVPAR